MSNYYWGGNEGCNASVTSHIWVKLHLHRDLLRFSLFNNEVPMLGLCMPHDRMAGNTAVSFQWAFQGLGGYK